MNLYQPTITGSLSVSGSVNISGSITIAGGGTISGTASIATTALTASFVENAQTASYVLNAVSSSFALTASSADNLLVRNTLTAQTLVVQTITSSVDFVTGSTRFGSISANTHVFTGSVSISGSGITINGTGSIIGSGTTSYLSKFTSAGVVSSSSTLSESGNILTQAATGQTLYIVNANTSGDSGFQMRLDGTLNAHLYTDRTNSKLTLGTLTALPFTVETNSTESMRITSGGDVGIGTSTIYYASTGRRALEINGTTNSFLAFKVGNVGKSYLFQNGTDFIITNLAAAGGYLALENNGAERMRISSAGLVTKPYQTYFIARATNSTLTSNGSTVQKLPYSTIDKNIGSAYNGTTYTFTAPVTGIYQFNWQMFVPPSGYIFCNLYINDVQSHSIEWNNAATANYHTLWGGVAKSLTANDTVYLALYSPNGYTVHLNGAQPGPGSFFSGYLLG
jgi:hypothetical protein